MNLSLLLLSFLRKPKKEALKSANSAEGNPQPNNTPRNEKAKMNLSLSVLLVIFQKKKKLARNGPENMLGMYRCYGKHQTIRILGFVFKFLTCIYSTQTYAKKMGRFSGGTKKKKRGIVPWRKIALHEKKKKEEEV